MNAMTRLASLAFLTLVLLGCSKQEEPIASAGSQTGSPQTPTPQNARSADLDSTPPAARAANAAAQASVVAAEAAVVAAESAFFAASPSP